MSRAVTLKEYRFAWQFLFLNVSSQPTYAGLYGIPLLSSYTRGGAEALPATPFRQITYILMNSRITYYCIRIEENIPANAITRSKKRKKRKKKRLRQDLGIGGEVFVDNVAP